MLAKDATTVVADSGLVENEQALTVIKAAGDVVKEQAEMDPEKTSAGTQDTITFTPSLLCCLSDVGVSERQCNCKISSCSFRRMP